MGAVVGRRQAVGLALFRPAGACGRPDAQGPELVEGEDPVREVLQDVLDTVELGVAVWARGLLLDDEVLVVSAEQTGTASRGSKQARPISLNRWITSRTVPSSAWTSWAITGTRFPPAGVSSIMARR